jgi:hypothetical protein
MKNTCSMIIMLMGVAGFGYLYAHQSGMESSAKIQVAQKQAPLIVNLSDSSHSEPWAGDESMTGNIRDRLAEIFKGLEDFSFRLKDSALVEERFQYFFDGEFQKKLEHFRSEVFDEQFIQRLGERLEDFNKKDFNIDLNKDFRQHLLEKLDKMNEKLEELDQQLQEKRERGKAI